MNKYEISESLITFHNEQIDYKKWECRPEKCYIRNKTFYQIGLIADWS